MSEPQQSEEVILDAARRMEAAERTVFLEKTCGSNPQMRQRVESLLAGETPNTSAPSAPATHAGPFGPTGTLITDADATLGESATVALPAEEAPGDAIGRYKLLEKIGEGGFGMVYVAEQTEPVKRRVALKIIKLGMDTRQVVARFEAERQALALMDHPNIAKVLDAGATDTGRPYFVMELVRGTKITEHCDRNKLPTRKRLDLFMLVGRAIEHAHQKGIIHRDIKPSNILVSIHDGVAVPKVIDFGIAKATQGNLSEKTVYTQIDQFVGTPAYMSPEQAEAGGLDIDTRSDIYSLGVLLYELLTGETPLESKNLLERGFDEMRKVIREWEPQLPSIRLHKRGAEDQTTVATRHGTDAPKLIKMVRGDLDWVVMKCLEKDRARRYDSAAELTAEIQRFLNNEPVVARPPSNVYRFQKMVRRNRLAFAAGGAIFASLIVALVLTSWSFIKMKNEAQVAENANLIAERNLKIAVAERAKAEEALAQTEVAHKQSTVDLQRSQEADLRAEAANKDAAAARQEAETARQRAADAARQAREDRDKAELAQKAASEAQAQAQTAHKQADYATALADAATVERDAANKTTAAETTLRKQAETKLAASETSLRQAIADRDQANAGVAEIWQTILPQRLESLPPTVALQAFQAVFPPADSQQPWPASQLRRRGAWRARMGDWTNAIADYSRAIELEPSNIMSYNALAALFVQNGQTNDYGRLCARLLAKFDSTNDPAFAAPVARDCLLAPWPGADLAHLAALARNVTNDNQITVGLAEYRMGHYAAAADLLGNALATRGQNQELTAEACATLALAQQQLRQTTNALATLARGGQIVETELPKLESGDIGADWIEWITARALLCEATALIKPPPAAKSP